MFMHFQHRSIQEPLWSYGVKVVIVENMPRDFGRANEVHYALVLLKTTPRRACFVFIIAQCWLQNSKSLEGSM